MAGAGREYELDCDLLSCERIVAEVDLSERALADLLYHPVPSANPDVHRLLLAALRLSFGHIFGYYYEIIKL